MHEIDQSEPELDLDELSEWLEKEYAIKTAAPEESGCVYDQDHVSERELCLVHD